MDTSMTSTLVAVSLGVLLALGLVRVILFAVRRVHAAGLATLEAEGISRRSGRVRIHLSLHDYRGPQVRSSSATSIRTGELVLTGKGLVLLTPYVIRLGAPPWSGLTAEVREGKLHLLTEQPPEATGKVEVTVHAPEPETWVSDLERLARNSSSSNSPASPRPAPEDVTNRGR